MPRLLIVEDDEDQASLFTQVLEVPGYLVVVAMSAKEAQARLAAEPFALLLADCDLGGKMNGDALITWTKTQYPDIKTILFSNYPAVNELADACGADAAFRKADGIFKLRNIVSALLPGAADHP